MNPEDLKEILQQLINVGEPSIARAMELAIRRNFLLAIQDFVWSCLCAGGIWFLWGKRNYDDDEMFKLFWGSGVFLLVVLFLATVFFGLDRLLNPELWALDNLVNILFQ